jgi:hypothetical protein
VTITLPHRLIIVYSDVESLVAMFSSPSPEPEHSRNEEQQLRRIFTLNCSRNVHVPGPEFPASKVESPLST